MVVIKEVSAKSILDSRKEKTILVSIKIKSGKTFSASSPSGKSTGKYEAKPYKKNLEEDIITLKKFKDYFSEEIIEEFNDLKRIEDILEGHVGANTLFAFESAVLKAISFEKKKEVWEIIDFESRKSRKFPRLVGNCIGGGKHSSINKKPDFQEFLLIPEANSPEKSLKINKEAKEKAQFLIKRKDNNFKLQKNDEDAWMTSLNEKEVLDILSELNIHLGVDVASSSFYSRKKYSYENPMLKRDKEEQFGYIANLIKNYNLIYIEDPFEEEDFEGFKLLTQEIGNKIQIVGDDLFVTNKELLAKGIEIGACNSILIKVNQIGTVTETLETIELAKNNNYKTIISHRSGETEDTYIADFAVGLNLGQIKTGSLSRTDRICKYNQLLRIEEQLKK